MARRRNRQKYSKWSKNPKAIKARAGKAEEHLPFYMQQIAFRKTGKKGWRKTFAGIGKFGPTSEVRHIDPSEYGNHIQHYEVAKVMPENVEVNEWQDAEDHGNTESGKPLARDHG